MVTIKNKRLIKAILEKIVYLKNNTTGSLIIYSTL